MKIPDRLKGSKSAPQSKRFIEAAKAVDADDDKERFEKRLGKIAKATPEAKARERK